MLACLQVLTAVLARLTLGKAPITLQAACKTGEKYWGKGNGEETLLFHKGELITWYYGQVAVRQVWPGARRTGEPAKIHALVNLQCTHLLQGCQPYAWGHLVHLDSRQSCEDFQNCFDIP